jgi:hypothetical protein
MKQNLLLISGLIITLGFLSSCKSKYGYFTYYSSDQYRFDTTGLKTMPVKSSIFLGFTLNYAATFEDCIDKALESTGNNEYDLLVNGKMTYTNYLYLLGQIKVKGTAVKSIEVAERGIPFLKSNRGN